MTVRHPPLGPMSPFEDRERYVDRMGSDVHKMKTLLLENYRGMYSKMHENTSEKARIGKLIEELNESLQRAEPSV